MAQDDTLERPTPARIASYVKKNARKTKSAQMAHHMPSESVREADYEGHHIVIRTTYTITVDRVPITGHMGVTNDGQVHYHPVPNVSFASAVDLVKRLIDVFPDDFPPAAHSSRSSRRPSIPEMRMTHPKKAKKRLLTKKRTGSATKSKPRGSGKK
jgi:hypothetical protein